MCFFILPKISPLNFMFAFLGASLFVLSYIFLTAFRLSLQQWILSNCLLLIVVVLFCYDSYSSERLSRERWLLRDRLQRERINLNIVASSIQDDLSKSSEQGSLSIMGKANISPAVFSSMRAGRNINMNTSSGRVSSSPEEAQSRLFVLFFKGLIAWALCYAFGYSFDFISLPLSSLHPREVNSSAAFALMMHSMGFSIFLLYFTGQIRWLALNGVVSLLIMFAFNQSGMSQKWVIFSTHSLGYVLLFVVVVIMVLVFGGVVLVWHHLVNFLKDVLTRYPQVKDDLGQNRLLESVLIRYIADMPSTLLSSEDDSHELIIQYGGDEENSRSLAIPSEGPEARPRDSFTRLPHSKLTVLKSRRPDTCFFCLKPSPCVLVPACEGWEQLFSEDRSAGIAMCTPYTEMATSRERMREALEEAVAERNRYHEEHQVMQQRLAAAEETALRCREHLASTTNDLKKRYIDIETLLNRLVKECDNRVTRERMNFDSRLQSLISQHNAELADLKKKHKQALLKTSSCTKAEESWHKSGSTDGEELPRSEDQSLNSSRSTSTEQLDVNSFKASTEKEKRASIISVVPPRKSNSTGITLLENSSKKVTVAESSSLMKVKAIRASNSDCDRLLSSTNISEQDEFDDLWRKSLEEIQSMFSAAFFQVANTNESYSEQKPDSLLNLEQRASGRMKYTRDFLVDDDAAPS